MDGVMTCGGAKALGMVLWLAGSFGIAMAQDRREALEALERERTQAWRDAQAHNSPQWMGASGITWLPPVAGERPCFAIQRFELANDRSSATSTAVEGFSWLLKDLGAFEGACLGPQSLEALRRNLDARLVSRGYVTSSVSFAPQSLSNGVLRISLQLGRVARVDRRGAASTIGPNAMAIKPGDVLNLRDIEQTLENLARLPSQAAQFQIEAADRPDQSVVVIATLPARTWRVGAGLDNTAARDCGRLQAAVQAVWDAPLGLSDQVAMYLNGTARNEGGERHQRTAMFTYSIPMGRNLLSINTSHSRHARPIQGLTTRFSENGFDDSMQWRWQHTAWRSASTRWTVWVGATERQSRNAVDDVELVLQRRHTRHVDWGLDGWLRFGAGEFTLNFDATVPRRVGADTDVQLDPPALARTQRVQFGWQQPLSLGSQAIHYETRLAWTGVRNPASGADLQNLGSRWTVRGFDAQGFLTGREQITWRHDLRLAGFAVALLPGVQMQPYLGLDYGRIGGAATSDFHPGHVLAGATAGLRFGGHGLSGDLALAAPLHKPAGFAAPSTVFYVSLNFNY